MLRFINLLTFLIKKLKGIDIKETDGINRTEVNVGTPLGFAGVSGSIANKGHAPHLHLEVAKVLNAKDLGESVITNPAKFVRLNSYNPKDEDDENENKPHYHKN